MELSASINIERPVEDVWKAIIDFENCSNYIESIIKLDIVNQPKDTLIDFKWKETRAESHDGSIYTSRLFTMPVGEDTRLTMSFSD